MTIYLVRHGSAGSRNESDPHDLERHLDSGGRRQATQLVDVLATQPIDVVHSSPAPRCIESVEPLANSRGLSITTKRSLLEGSPIDEAWNLVESLASAGRHAVLCSHGDVIPDIVRRAQARGMDVPGKSGCSKGSLWTLRWDQGRFDQGIYTPNKD